MKELYKLKEMYRKLYLFFGSYEKTSLWFRSPNLNFGGISPTLLIRRRGMVGLGKVELFIEGAIDDPYEK